MANGSVAATVRRLREQRGWSQVDLARVSGVARTTINELEQGGRDHRIGTLRALAVALDMPIEAITGAATEPPSATDDDDDEVLLAQAGIGRMVADARADFPDDDDYRLFYESVLRQARDMREIARRKGRRGDGG